VSCPDIQTLDVIDVICDVTWAGWHANIIELVIDGVMRTSSVTYVGDLCWYVEGEGVVWNGYHWTRRSSAEQTGGGKLQSQCCDVMCR